jgi:competence protein ComEA
MSMWVHPDMNKGQEEKLNSAWQAYKKDHVATFDDDQFRINVNTADSQTLVQIKGIGPVSAHNIIADRNENGKFIDMNDIWELGKFPEATIDYLESRLYIDSLD